MPDARDDDPCKGYGQRRCPRCGELTHVDDDGVGSPVRRCDDDECIWHVPISGNSDFT